MMNYQVRPRICRSNLACDALRSLSPSHSNLQVARSRFPTSSTRCTRTPSPTPPLNICLTVLCSWKISSQRASSTIRWCAMRTVSCIFLSRTGTLWHYPGLRDGHRVICAQIPQQRDPDDIDGDRHLPVQPEGRRSLGFQLSRRSPASCCHGHLVASLG